MSRYVVVTGNPALMSRYVVVTGTPALLSRYVVVTGMCEGQLNSSNTGVEKIWFSERTGSEKPLAQYLTSPLDKLSLFYPRFHLIGEFILHFI
jgi:hypothetical protein